MNDERWATASGWSSEQNSMLDQMHYGLEYRKKNRMLPQGAAAVAPELPNGEVISRSEAYMRQRGASASGTAISKLSQTRQDYLREQNERAPSNPRPNLGLAAPVAPRIKTASVAASSQGRLHNSSNTSHMGPDIYSPFYLTQNLMLPRDRQTMNAWNRAFYDVNPYVRNAINLHSTYPISKLTIKCEDKKVEQFFLDMAERLDLQTVVQNAAGELWQLGECINYASFNESTGSWDHIYQHNPDYIRVHASPLMTGQPVISLRPDPELMKIINSNDPEHVMVREQIDPKIIEHVQRNEAIPLDNFNVSHLKMLNRPYDLRGTSIINSVWRQLMLLDKIYEAKLSQFDGMINPITLVKLGENGIDGHYPRQDEIDAFRTILECHDEETEVLTSEGFKKFHEVMIFEEDGLSGTRRIAAKPIDGLKIACFNKETEQLEYHEPKNASLSHYDGDMYHWKNKKIDIKVTPNHKMLVSEDNAEWAVVEAKDIRPDRSNRFRSEDCSELAGKAMDFYEAPTASIEQYSGKVWCFEVPTGFFVTRRNGKVTIQHNSAQFDKDFKIVTHQGVTIDRVGFSGQTLDVSGDIDKLIDAVLIGLMVPKSVLTQEGATYASASVALDVMRQRYNSFRTMMANWLEKKIFAPISEVQGFYTLTAGKKELIVPHIEWNKMSLHDMSDYIGHIRQGVDKNQISHRTLDVSLGLNRHNEIVNIRQEMIESAIQKREAEALASMSLAELRALDPEEEIIVPEKEKSLLPGQTPLPDQSGGAGAGLDLGLPPPPGGGGGLDLGPLPGGGPDSPPTPPPLGPGGPPLPPGP